VRLFHTLQPRARWGRALFAIVLTSALFVFPAASPYLTQAVGQLVSTQDISNTSKNSEAPQISAGGGRLAAVWAERDTTSSGSFGFTQTAVDTSFPGASIQETGSDARYQWADVVIDPNGTSHIVYSAGSTVSYQRRTLAGGKSTIKIASANFPNSARIARGPNGALWALWRDTNGHLFYKYSTNNGDSWVNGSDGGVISNGSGTALTIDIVVDLSNVPHVVWYNNGGTSKGQIRYADWNGSSFVTSELTTDSFYDADPVATVDGTNIMHVVWRKQITGPPNEKWSVFHASRPAGGSFGNFEGIATISGNPGFAPGVGSDTSGNLYATYSEQQASNNRHVLLMNKLAGQNWDGPMDLKVAGRRFDSRSVVVGTSQSGAEAHVLIQSDLATDDAEVFYKRVSFGPSLSAQPTIEAGKTATKNNPVSVSFSVQGSPKELRWNWGSPPTDTDHDSTGTNGWQTFTNPKSIPLPTNPSICEPLTLYTQVKDGGTIEGSAKSDTIEYDNAIQATVDVMNPHLAGLPATFLGVADNASTKSSDGDPSYTRDATAWLKIADAGDCSGLSSFTVVSGNPPNPVFTNGKFEGKVSLPQTNIANPGSTATISVVIVDGSGNLTPSFSRTIIYDPADTDPSSGTNELGLPVVNAGNVSVDTDNSIIRTLSFSNVNVDDNVYGKKENLPAGRQFWGVWIANATSDVGAANPNLQWYPVEVPSPNSSFSVKWNIFTGLNIGPNRNATGDYFVYVRFLDGAGNPSVDTTARKVKVTLTAGYTIPTIDMPMITK